MARRHASRTRSSSLPWGDDGRATPFEKARLKLRGARYRILSDSRAFGVQAGMVMAGFDRIAKRGAELHDGRRAIVVSTQLNKLQAGRVLMGRKRGYFWIMTPRAWMLADEDG